MTERTDIHVIPAEDLKEHIDHQGCQCEPAVDGDVVIHNAWDGREFFEADTKGFEGLWSGLSMTYDGNFWKDPWGV